MLGISVSSMRRIVAAWACATAMLGAPMGALGQSEEAETVTAAADIAAAIAETGREIGPPVGAPISSALFGPDHTGSITDFNDLVGPRGLVLVFVRSVDWCPICRIETMQAYARRAEFAAREVGFAFVSEDAPADAEVFVDEDLGPGARLIAAKGGSLVERMDLIDPTFPEDNRYYGAPFPTALIIDRDGVLRAKLFLEAPPADAYGSGQSLTAAGYDWDAQMDELLALVDAAFWTEPERTP